VAGINYTFLDLPAIFSYNLPAMFSYDLPAILSYRRQGGEAGGEAGWFGSSIGHSKTSFSKC